MKARDYAISMAVILFALQVLDVGGFLFRKELVLSGDIFPLYTAVETQAEERAMQETLKQAFTLQLGTPSGTVFTTLDLLNPTDKTDIDLNDPDLTVIGDFDFQTPGAKKIFLQYDGATIGLEYYVTSPEAYEVSSYEELAAAQGYDHILMTKSITIPEDASVYLGQCCKIVIAPGCCLTVNGHIGVADTLNIYGETAVGEHVTTSGYIQTYET